jgi:hypothetical protein
MGSKRLCVFPLNTYGTALRIHLLLGVLLSHHSCVVLARVLRTLLIGLWILDGIAMPLGCLVFDFVQLLSPFPSSFFFVIIISKRKLLRPLRQDNMLF